MDKSAFDEMVRERINQLYTEAWHLQMYLNSCAGKGIAEGHAEPAKQIPVAAAEEAEPPKLGAPLPKQKPGRKPGSRPVYTPEQEQDIIERYQAGESLSDVNKLLGYEVSSKEAKRLLASHGITIRSRKEQVRISHARKSSDHLRRNRNNGRPGKSKGEECLA